MVPMWTVDLVADGELVEPGGQCPVAFEPVDAALHRMALAVVDRIEPGRPATAGPAPPSVAGLVGRFGDRGRDAPPPQMSPDRPGRVSLVCAHPLRPGARVPAADAGDPDPGHDHLELGSIAPLPGGDHQPQRLLAAV
jgi:hypothetical protein